MSKLLRSAVIINLALLVVFIWLDVLTWSNVAVGLDSLVLGIQREGSTLSGFYVGGSFPLQIGISVGYFPNVTAFVHVYETVSSVNLPLIWFIATIAVNLSLIWRSGTKRVSDQTKGSKTEISSKSCDTF